jgi:sarcosine oxidase, subunit gamma
MWKLKSSARISLIPKENVSVANAMLKPLTALGNDAAKMIEIGGYRIVERFDMALASLATRRNQEKVVAKAAMIAKLILPEPSQSSISSVYGAFWLSSEQWMIEAPFETHEDIATHLKTLFGDSASITEQTDAWVRFDVTSGNVQSLFERLCNVDLQKKDNGFATRTVIEHIGCYLIKRSANDVTLYGPRSMAASLLHALDVTAHAVM